MNKDFTSQESLFINYAKALGIISVVIGHYPWYPTKIYNPYIYHMPLFFLIGGILAKPIKDWKQWGLKIAKNYILYTTFWYFVLAICCLLLNKLIGSSINIDLSSKGRYNYLSLPITSNMHNNGLFQVAWFFIAYMFATSFFKIILSLADPLKIKGLTLYMLLSGIFLGSLCIEYISLLYKQDGYWLHNLLCQIGVGYMFVSFGFVLRNYLHMLKNIALLMMSIALMITFVGNGSFHPLFMAWSNYPDGFIVHTISSLLGCFGLLSVAYILSRSVESSVLLLVGASTKAIMTLHFLAFVIVDLLLTYLLYFQIEMITGQTHYVNPSTWPLYIGFGLFCPILIRKLSCSFLPRSMNFLS